MSDRTREPSPIRDAILDLGYDRFVEVTEAVDHLTDAADIITPVLMRGEYAGGDEGACRALAAFVAAAIGKGGLLADSYDRLLLALAAAREAAEPRTVEVRSSTSGGTGRRTGSASPPRRSTRSSSPSTTRRSRLGRSRPGRRSSPDE